MGSWPRFEAQPRPALHSWVASEESRSFRSLWRLIGEWGTKWLLRMSPMRASPPVADGPARLRLVLPLRWRRSDVGEGAGPGAESGDPPSTETWLQHEAPGRRKSGWSGN